MILNPEITLGNILTITTMIGGLSSIWFKMRASVERLELKQTEHSESLKNIMEDRSNMKLLASTLQQLGERITNTNARIDEYHKRLHINEDRVNNLDTAIQVAQIKFQHNQE